MSKLSRALGELTVMRSLASSVEDPSLRANLTAKIDEVERLVKSAKHDTK